MSPCIQSGTVSGITTAAVNRMVSSGSERTTSMMPPAVRLITGMCERRASARITDSGMPSTATEQKMKTVSDSPPHCSVVTRGMPRTPPYISSKKMPNPISHRLGRRLMVQNQGRHDSAMVAMMTRQASVERQCSSNG